MTCFFCKGERENISAVFTVELDNCIIVIKNVPTDSCMKCGQKSYSNEVAGHIEKIVNNMRNVVTEVAVVRYTESIVA